MENLKPFKQDITKICFLPGSIREVGTISSKYNYINLLKLGLKNLGVTFPSEDYVFSNGITQTGSDVKLGGVFTEDTQIGDTGHNFTLICGVGTINASRGLSLINAQLDLDIEAQDGNVNITSSNEINLSGLLNVGVILEYADNAAAIIGGLVIGNIYRTVDVLKVVH